MTRVTRSSAKITDQKENLEKISTNTVVVKKMKLKEKKRIKALAQLEKQKSEIPRGIAKSGRIWKTPKEK